MMPVAVLVGGLIVLFASVAFMTPGCSWEKWSQMQPAQICRGRVTGCVARHWQIQRATLLRKCFGWRLHCLSTLLHLYRSFDESHGEASLKVPLDVACKACDQPMPG